MYGQSHPACEGERLLLLTDNFNNVDASPYFGRDDVQSVTANQSDSVGGTSAVSFTEDSSGDGSVSPIAGDTEDSRVDLTTGKTYIFEMTLKQFGGRWCTPTIWDDSFGHRLGGVFNLEDGLYDSSFNSGSSFTSISNEIKLVGNGFYRCRMRFSMSLEELGCYWYVSMDADGTYTPDDTGGLIIESAGFFEVL